MQNTNMYLSSSSSSSSSSSLDYLIPLIILSIQLVPFCFANDHKFPATFTCKSLVRIADAPSFKSTATPTNVNHQRVLEIEESYDETRKLGKLTVLDQGERIELFIQAKDSLYLEAHYRQDGSLANCKTWSDRPNEGFFGLFRDMIERSSDESRRQQQQQQQQQQSEQAPHLIGPASLLYLFHKDLQPMWSARQKIKLNSTTTGVNGKKTYLLEDGKLGGLFDRRQDDPAKMIQFSLGANSFTGANKVVSFKQSDFFIERSTYLSELAELAIFASGDDRLFIIDYLAIDHLDPNASALDLFKLPSRFTCISTSSHSDNNYGLFNFEQVWPSKVPVGRDGMEFSIGRSLSVIFHESEFHPEGVKFIIDADRQVLRFDIDGHSENLVDVKRAIVYHMPIEVSPNVDTALDVSKGERPTPSGLRNNECSIMSMENILPFKQSLSLEPTVWSMLVGQTDKVVYLGRSRFINGRAAHEFEINYKSAADLPGFFNLLVGLQSSGRQLATGGKLVARLWLSIESCSELYSTFVCNNNPYMLGFRLESVNHDKNGIIEIVDSKLVQISEFQWEPFGLTDYGLSDIGKCPLKKLHLSSDVRWIGGAVDALNNNHAWLDGVIRHQFRDFMRRANIELNVAHIERQLFPSTTIATYLIELLENPNQMISYNLIEEGKQLSKSDLRSSLIKRTVKMKTLFECLAWSSLFKTAGVVLYSSKPAECIVYESDERKPLNERPDREVAQVNEAGKATQYHLYAIQVDKSTFSAKKEQSMDYFTSQQLREVNKVMLNSQSKFKLDGAQSEINVQFGPLKILHRQATGISHYPGQTTSLYRSGYRFLERTIVDDGADGMANAASSGERDNYDLRKRAQVASISLAQCMSRCEANPLCASFSYCKYTDLEDGQYCQLADLRLSSVDKVNTSEAIRAPIEGQLTRDAGCEIHAKDYLQYYQPEEGEVSSLDQPSINWHQDVSAKTLPDCAGSCHTSSGLACLRFTYCQAEARCLLWLTDEGLSSREMPQTTPVYIDREENVNETSYVNREKIASDSLTDCALFKRKSISLYQRTVTTRSGGLQWTGEGLVESRLEHVSKESCADRCQAEAECRSFDSCRIVSGTAPSFVQSSSSSIGIDEWQVSSSKPNNDILVYRYDCVLLSGSVFDDNQMRLIEVAGSKSTTTFDVDEGKLKTVKQTQCTHYERSAKKQNLSPQKVKLILQSLQLNIGKLPTSSYLTNLFCAALFGLVLGLSARFVATIMKHRGAKPI